MFQEFTAERCILNYEEQRETENADTRREMYVSNLAWADREFAVPIPTRKISLGRITLFVERLAPIGHDKRSGP